MVLILFNLLYAFSDWVCVLQVEGSYRTKQAILKGKEYKMRSHSVFAHRWSHVYIEP